MDFDAYRFIEQIRARYWLGMLAAIDSALIHIARGPAVQRRSSARAGDDVEFMRFLSAARSYLLAEGRLRPAGMSDDQFLLLKPLCDHLVQTGRFATATLGLFQPTGWPMPQLPASADPETTATHTPRT
jgi:hypothetical protein